MAAAMDMTFMTRISEDPTICGGEPCIKGTRVLVRVVLGHLAAGDSIATILEGYPTIAEEDVRACLAFASHLAHERTVIR